MLKRKVFLKRNPPLGLHDDPVFCVYFYEEIFPRKVHVRNYLKDPDTNPLSVEVNENNDN